MRRRTLLHGLFNASVLSLLPRLSEAQTLEHQIASSFPALKTRALPWDRLLEPERFQILFLQETEFAGSSSLNDEHRTGTYVCAACNLPLFRSRHKYDSGTGWPSFTQPIERHIETRTDRRGRKPIIEYHCARCGGHQGHVFDDGPPPRGERWCNNGLALLFISSREPLPALRE
jgi:peptide-methionine (R)-S-oxide reductase